MGDRSPVLQWERRGGLKRSGGLGRAEVERGLDWKPGVVARRRKWRPGGGGPEISKQLTLSLWYGVSLLLEIKRERRLDLLDRRGKMKCAHI